MSISGTTHKNSLLSFPFLTCSDQGFELSVAMASFLLSGLEGVQVSKLRTMLMIPGFVDEGVPWYIVQFQGAKEIHLGEVSYLARVGLAQGAPCDDMADEERSTLVWCPRLPTTLLSSHVPY